MPSVAVFGAGDLGGSIAHALTERARVASVLLVDEPRQVAAGKALDILQGSALSHSPVRLDSASDVLACTAADVIVFADPAGESEGSVDRVRAAAEQLARTSPGAALVFAGAGHTSLMEICARDLGVDRARLIGTAASALTGVARALTGAELGGSGVDVQITVTGRPPSFVLAWSSATVGGSLVSDRLPAHRLRAIAQAVNRLWPPGPRATAAATARVIEGLLFGSRQLQSALTVVDGELGLRHTAILLPLELGGGRILGHRIPSLTPQERLGAY